MIKILMPPGGQTTNSSVITKWHKQVGETVKRGDVLFDIETDKAVLQIESFGQGVLLEQCYGEGDEVATGEVCAYIGETGEAPLDEPPAEKEPINKPELAALPCAQTLEHNELGGAIQASPAARKLLKDKGFSLVQMADVFPDKVIKRQDVLSYLEAQSSPQTSPACVPTPLSDRLCLRAEIDLSGLLAYSEKLNNYVQKNGTIVSLNDFLMVAAGKALAKVFGAVGVSVAVGVVSGRDILFPVIPGADQKSLFAVAVENAANSERAVEKTLSAEQICADLTLLNLEEFGISECFPAFQNSRYMLTCGRVDSANMLNLCLAADSGIDLLEACEFMSAMKGFLEEPLFMVM